MYIVLKLRRQWHPPPVLLPGKSHGRRSLVGYSLWGRKESDMTEPLHFLKLRGISTLNGEGNGNPLQCSCLENPRDREAWWAALYGVAQSQTRLKRLSSSSSSSSTWNEGVEIWAEENTVAKILQKIMETNSPELKSKDFRLKLKTQIRSKSRRMLWIIRGCEGDKFLDRVWLWLCFLRKYPPKWLFQSEFLNLHCDDAMWRSGIDSKWH